MAFTDNSDLFGALHEEGVNRVVRHIRRQRPSLFNYGTALVQANPELLCERIDVAPGVTTFITVQPPLPLFGADHLALNYCFQFTGFEIEFHPGNVITLPSELNPPLPEQRFAFRAALCGGIGCPSRENRILIDFLIRQTKLDKKMLLNARAGRASATSGFAVSAQQQALRERQFVGTSITERRPIDVFQPIDTGGVLELPDPPVTVFPTQKISCFCLELFAKGQSSISTGNEQFSLKLDGLEIVDLAPEGLENSLECYFLLVANNVIFPQVNEAVSTLLFGVMELGELGSFSFSAPTTVPHNPAIEEDQLKLFLNMENISLNIPPIEISDEESESPEITKTTKNRIRTGPAHLTAALSENVFKRIFDTIRDNTSFHITGERTIADGGLGKVIADVDIRFHLDNGAVSFANNNTINIDELDIKWDKLSVRFKFDIREICTPKVCIPFTDICTPQWCIFESDSDFEIPLNIPTIFTTEVSFTASPKAYYGTAPVTQWLVYLEPGPVDVDIIDVSDTIGDLLDDAIEAVVDALNLPDIVEDVLGVFADVIRTLLDVGDDVGEWISDLIFNTLGISVGISELIAKNLTEKSPLLQLPDPLIIMPAEAGPPALPAVGIPIEFLGAQVNADEMIITVDIKE